jgi:hypothetical protein
MITSHENLNIYFYCAPFEENKQPYYQHCLVALGEGLQELGIRFCSNVNYWQENVGEKATLFQHNQEILPDDCSVVVVGNHWMAYANELPGGLFHPKRKYLTVYIDQADENRSRTWEPGMRQFDLILKAHYNERCWYPKNVQPWAFGLTRRIYRALHNPPAFEQRENRLLVNFRVPHPVRKRFAEKALPLLGQIIPIDETIDPIQSAPEDPQDKLDWLQTGSRHNQKYFERLLQSTASVCVGGRFDAHWPRHPYARRYPWHPILNKLDARPKRIVQWDSWRFWESLAAGCLAINIDLEYYGAVLPVQPVNWQDYLGVNLQQTEQIVQKLKTDPALQIGIANNGRRWVLENYSPRASAQRFIQIISAR